MTHVREEIVAGCRILDGERLTDAFGHLSARGDRDGDFWITPRFGPGLVRSVDELLGVNGDGEVVWGDPALMPGEAPIHLRLLHTRDKIGAVCRFWGMACTAFGSLGLPLPMTTGIGLTFGCPVPVFDAALGVTTAEASEALDATLDGGSAVLLRGFGAVTVGSTVAEAVVRATLLERSAQAVLVSLMAGVPREYTAAEGNAVISRFALSGQIDRAWTYLKRRWPQCDE